MQDGRGDGRDLQLILALVSECCIFSLPPNFTPLDRTDEFDRM